MSQYSEYQNTYRLFFKNLTDIEGRSLSSPQLRVKNFSVKRDILTKQTSSFEVLQMPNAVLNGDIVGMYDSYGSIVFLGVVTEIKDNNVYAEQIIGIFDDNWLWNNPREASIEETLKTIIENDFQNNRDTLMSSIFSSFDITTTSTTNLTLQSQEEHYVTNFMSFLYDVYEKYGILININIPFEQETPTISIGKPNYRKLQIGNNTYAFRNFNIVNEVFETNKLVVYGEENGQYRGEWFTTTSGITDNPSALNRIQRIKTNIIFSDDDLNILKASSLRNQIFNHRIECDLVVENKLLNFDLLKLGQEVDLYYNGDYYNTILTGYQLDMSDGRPSEVIHLTFGLVRTSLTSKLFKRLNK